MIINTLSYRFCDSLSSTEYSLFKINPTVHSSIFYLIQYYISFVLAGIPSNVLVMASIGRSLPSSRNINIRLRSTQCFTTLMIGIICIFSRVFHVQAFFTVDLQLINGLQLIYISISFLTFYKLICIGIILPSLMTVFEIRILINTKQSRVNQGIRRDLSGITRRDNQSNSMVPNEM
jgi:hypothetical protein